MRSKRLRRKFKRLITSFYIISFSSFPANTLSSLAFSCVKALGESCLYSLLCHCTFSILHSSSKELKLCLLNFHSYNLLNSFSKKVKKIHISDYIEPSCFLMCITSRHRICVPSHFPAFSATHIPYFHQYDYFMRV